MRNIIQLFTLFIITVILSTTNLVSAGRPISSVSVSLLGTKYDVKDVSTVAEIKEKLKSIIPGANIVDNTKVDVMFDGKVLDSSTILSDVGVDEGSTLVLMPSGLPSKDDMEKYLESAGISKEKLDEMMKSLGGGSGENGTGGGMPSLEDSIKAMSDVMNSPMLQEMLSDPDKLEQSRLMILNNPMLKNMMASMPGMDDLINDPIAWRQAMQAAATMYKNMDPTTLMSSMLGGAMNRATSSTSSSALDSSMDGSNFLHLDMLGTTDDSPSSTSAKKALEELDEDD